MSELTKAIGPYRDANGMVGLKPNVEGRQSDNGLLFTSEYMLLLRQQPDTASLEINEESMHFHHLVRACSKYPGLLMRYPGDVDGDEAHDDYRGVAAVSPDHARAIYDYGSRNKFCWNSKSPDKFDLQFCYDRFFGFTAVLLGGAGGSLPLGEQLSFFISCFGILFDKRETSPVILHWVSCAAVENKGLLSNIGIAIWRAIAMRKWKGGLRQCMSVYFGVSHPLAQFAREDFN